MPPSYKGHRHPVEIIAHCVWLYHRFPLSFREVEELMLERGVVVSHETVRRWCAKFGQAYAGETVVQVNGSGHKVPSVLLPVVAVTRESVAEIIVKGGVYPAAQICAGPFSVACEQVGL